MPPIPSGRTVEESARGAGDYSRTVGGWGIRTLPAVAVVALSAVLVAVAGGASAKVRLPRDHYGHAAGIEWWYVTGVVRGADEHRYSVFFTLFKRGGFVLPVSQVVDLGSGTLVGHTESVAAAKVGSSSLDVAVPGASLRFEPRSNTWRFTASGGRYGLDLTAVPEKPYVLHGGGTGVIRQSVGGTSAYYSATRMRARGTIRRAGKPVRFTGTAWLDHQWGDFAQDPRAFNWDWFSCRFDDRTELMLYRFRDRVTGRPLGAYSEGTLVTSGGTGRRVRRFAATPGRRTLHAAGRRWPLDWTLDLPAEHLTLRLRSIVPDQLVRGRVLPTFWEGAATATGTKAGVCFVEESYR
jgi:predicted secreted hydrolase